jgi:hypothetical protein
MTFKTKYALWIIAYWIASPLFAQNQSMKYPTWLFGLDVQATPNKPITESMTDFYLYYNQFQSRTTFTTSGAKTYVAEDSYSTRLGVDYRTLIQNGSICLGVGASLGGEEIYSNYYAPGTRRSDGRYSDLDTSTRTISGTLSIQPKSGLWVGLRHEWLPEKTRLDTNQFSTAPTEATQSREHNTKTLGVQIINHPVQAGLDYAITNKSDLVKTDLIIPLRLAMSEKLFVGSKLQVIESDSINLGLDETTSSSTADFGYQGESSAYAFKFEYNVNRSALDSSVTTTKTKTGYFEAAFGKQQGLRYRFLTGYAYELSRNSSSVRGRKEGGVFKIEISRAQ